MQLAVARWADRRRWRRNDRELRWRRHEPRPDIAHDRRRHRPTHRPEAVVRLHDAGVPSGPVPPSTRSFGAKCRSSALGSANHDEAQFEDPERFDIGRQPNRHLAFGFGPHFCLGAPLARIEAKLAFRALLQRYTDIRPAVPRAELVWRRSQSVRGLTSLPLRVRR
ncbi:Cytochrome P450 [Nannocystis exedens]|uniref:Cytochrome P450 n=1 Tax=Nannocystis exedens TaxID=54 RepID=A0A1I2IGW2_9BACT|nr:cytochrome P450 [Nannocystis exedens]PCC73672.1 cytochrome P450 [Nannocystis exedens]SFF40903.1 Cytochrome P450 [Nannocystis exedens]